MHSILLLRRRCVKKYNVHVCERMQMNSVVLSAYGIVQENLTKVYNVYIYMCNVRTSNYFFFSNTQFIQALEVGAGQVFCFTTPQVMKEPAR